jgi:hypothetical protein
MLGGHEQGEKRFTEVGFPIAAGDANPTAHRTTLPEEKSERAMLRLNQENMRRLVERAKDESPFLADMLDGGRRDLVVPGQQPLVQLHGRRAPVG